jgi:hypothetical protein
MGSFTFSIETFSVKVAWKYCYAHRVIDGIFKFAQDLLLFRGAKERERRGVRKGSIL